MIVIEIRDAQGQVLGVLTAQPKTFKTGSRGYFAVGKIEIDGKRHQAQVQLVEIHSKPNDAVVKEQA